MTYQELKEKLNSLAEDQLQGTVQVMYSAEEAVAVELAIGLSTDALIFIPEFDFSSN